MARVLFPGGVSANVSPSVVGVLGVVLGRWCQSNQGKLGESFVDEQDTRCESNQRGQGKSQESAKRVLAFQTIPKWRNGVAEVLSFLDEAGLGLVPRTLAVLEDEL